MIMRSLEKHKTLIIAVTMTAVLALSGCSSVRISVDVLKESNTDTVTKELIDIFPEDILNAIRQDETAWKHYEAFSEPYRRIRVAYIDAARKRPAEFEKRLAHFIKMTRENRLIEGYGGVDKYYR